MRCVAVEWETQGAASLSGPGLGVRCPQTCVYTRDFSLLCHVSFLFMRRNITMAACQWHDRDQLLGAGRVLSSSFVHSDLGNTPQMSLGSTTWWRLSSVTRGNTPGFACFGGKPSQQKAPRTEDHTDFLALYTQPGELWFSYSVETRVSSAVADSQEFKPKCWPLVMKLLQNGKYFAYLRVKCLPFLTAVNIFA